MPLDPAAATNTASRPIPPLPQPHPHHHYPPQQQTLPIRGPNPLLAKPHDPHFVYPFAPKGARGLSAADHAVSTGFPPPSLMYGGGVRGMPLDYLSHALHVTRPLPHVPFPHVGNATTTPTASPPPEKAAARSAVSDINGGKDTSMREKSREDTYIVVRDRKVSPFFSYFTSFALYICLTVVRITEDASLYALCRSWLRNGIHEESQLKHRPRTDDRHG
ncbi:hypothetical protein CR513_30727, partial [Mucuna pruriens]